MFILYFLLIYTQNRFSESMSSNKGGGGRRVGGVLVKVKCRVCQKSVNKQSYRDHLKSKHEEEDELDLRVWGQPKLNLFGKRNVIKDVGSCECKG